MVLVAASICSRSGAILVSRQFLPVSRQRIESLLAQFPRLLQTNQQHTYVETEHVRFVYQPLESHYLVLTTTKGSNILQDMETLRLMARVVIDFASPLDDPSVLQSAALEILLAFDELVTLGWRENVNMTQLQTILAMESQEEIIQEIIAKNKMQEAKEAAKRKIKQIEMEKKEAARRNSSHKGVSSSSSIYPGSFSGANGYSPISLGGGSGTNDRDYGRSQATEEVTYIAPAAKTTSSSSNLHTATGRGSGMKLGGRRLGGSSGIL